MASTQTANLGWTIVNGALATTTGGLLDVLQSKLANGGRDKQVKFYYEYERGGKIVNVATRTLVNGAVSVLAGEAMAQYKKLIGGHKADKNVTKQAETDEQYKKAQSEDSEQYGFIKVKEKDSNSDRVICAFDDWGNICPDALMLSIPVAQGVKVSATVSNSATMPESVGKLWNESQNFVSDHLVWYDTTALINLNSDKDLVLTRVTGRDYSRKELVSNGDLNFSVSGHIVSTMPDIYPSQEVQKFRQIMQYKGIIEINNEFLDQWGIKKIVIKSFNLPSTAGNKAQQDYSFEAVGIQPDTEANVTSDTIIAIDKAISETAETNKKYTWSDVLKEQMEILKSASETAVSVGISMASNYLDNQMAKIDI